MKIEDFTISELLQELSHRNVSSISSSDIVLLTKISDEAGVVEFVIGEYLNDTRNFSEILGGLNLSGIRYSHFEKTIIGELAEDSGILEEAIEDHLDGLEVNELLDLLSNKNLVGRDEQAVKEFYDYNIGFPEDTSLEDASFEELMDQLDDMSLSDEEEFQVREKLRGLLRSTHEGYSELDRSLKNLNLINKMRYDDFVEELLKS